MTAVTRSLLFALVNLFHPRILWLMIWPLGLSIILWTIALLALWTPSVMWLAQHLKQWVESGIFFVKFDTGDAMVWIAKFLIVLLAVPIVWFTALLILSIFGMQAMVEHVAARRFPQLARRQGGSGAGSVWNGVVALAGLAALGVVSIPFWFVPPLWPLIPIVIMGWLNQRLLRYDALAEHATREEMRQLFSSERTTLYLLGGLLALLAYVPFLNLIVPALFGLAFIHHLLGALEALRGAPIEGEVLRG
ncbi:MAG: EI24 domain-containing protein [Burkholderiales bacterium]